ncbi:MAG: acetyl-CoA carboxylase carboxyltransferase subunit beta [Syntrophomonadaceae bacterium]|nr:acetyl-CoA carboxylase carboxyltransferase subunit beta [Syntrophomonadaceae bacterium]
MLKDIFERRPKKRYVTLPVHSEDLAPVEVPSVKRCPRCGKRTREEELDINLKVCSACDYHFPLAAGERIWMVTDEGSFVEFDEGLTSLNPLEFPGYPEKLARAREASGLNEAVVTGKGTIYGEPTVLGVMDSRFMMGSMGSVVGEKVTRAFERAGEEKLPVIMFTASGGARMQEGMISLMQMAKTSAAVGRFSRKGLLYVAVLTHPTTGGVTASFATLADIVVTEPGTMVGFAGPRVIEQTIGQKVPPGFQQAEFLLQHGMIDRIVHRKEMKEFLGKLLVFHRSGGQRGV